VSGEENAMATGIVGHDARTLFDKAWAHGCQTGLLSKESQDGIRRDGALAIKKIAGVLGSDHLRADLDRGMQSMLGLINIHLEHLSGGDVSKAAALLASERLIAHTRGANRMLKQLLSETHGTSVTEQSLEQWVVSDWALRPYVEVKRLIDEVQHKRELLALWHWMAAELSHPNPMDVDDAVSSEVELVLCTGLLILSYAKNKRWISRLDAFQLLLTDIRAAGKLPKGLPKEIPAAYRAVAGELWLTILDRPLSLILDQDQSIPLLTSGPLDADSLCLFMAVPGDDYDSMLQHEGETTGHWAALTGGKMDAESLMSLMLCAVYGFTEKNYLTLTEVKALATQLSEQFAEQAEPITAKRRTRAPAPRTLTHWLHVNVPHQYHAGLLDLWSDFNEEMSECSDLKAGIKDWVRVKAKVRSKPSIARVK
jgi:hypothetical protein